MSLKTNTKAPAKSTKKDIPKSDNKNVVALLKDITITYDSENIPLFANERDIIRIANIRCASDDNFLLNIQYQSLLYEIIGGFNKFFKENNIDGVVDYETVIRFLEIIAADENFSLKDEDITFLFQSPWYDKENKIYQGSLDRLKTKISVKKGVFKCPDCIRNKRTPVNNTESIEFQNRSSDEPLSVMNTCNNCNYKWVF
jgi:DNA-directed RNA polymerase subunit M/transcription elongation factor TFIIS